MRLKMLAVLTALAVAGIAAPAAASQDIPWTWNSEDQDARARFQAEGRSSTVRATSPTATWTGKVLVAAAGGTWARTGWSRISTSTGPRTVPLA